MPFRLKNAPATFQRLVDTLFDQSQGFSYSHYNVDDIAVYSQTWLDHLQDLCEALNRIKAARLTLWADKCLLKARSCEFLGHNIGGEVVWHLQTKVKAVTNFEKPRTKKNVRVFLGLTGYYRHFIPNYAEKTTNLTDALGGKKPEN